MQNDIVKLSAVESRIMEVKGEVEAYILKSITN